MFTRRFLPVSLTLAAALAWSAAWAAARASEAPHAASANAADAVAKPSEPAARTHPAMRSVVARHAAHAHHAGHSLAAMHQHVVLMRAAEQRHWIHAELKHHALDHAQATALQTAVRTIVDDQAQLARRGHETVAEALTVSHRQDVLDWAIHTGNAQYEPGRLRAIG